MALIARIKQTLKISALSVQSVVMAFCLGGLPNSPGESNLPGLTVTVSRGQQRWFTVCGGIGLPSGQIKPVKTGSSLIKPIRAKNYACGQTVKVMADDGNRMLYHGNGFNHH